MLEDGLGGRGAKDDGHDAAGAPAARAGEDVGLEGPLEELGPGDGAARPAWAGRARVPPGTEADSGSAGGRGRRRGHDAGTHPGVGGEDAEVADEVGPGGRDEYGQAAEEGHRRQDEVRLAAGRGPLHSVGEPAVGQGRQSLERQGPAGAVVTESLEARHVILVEPGVGVEGEAPDKGSPAARPAGGRMRPALRHLDAFELQDIERSIRDGLLLEHAARTQQREGVSGHGDGERLHLNVDGRGKRMQAQLRLVR